MGQVSGKGMRFKCDGETIAECKIVIIEEGEKTGGDQIILWVRSQRREQIECSYEKENAFEGFPHEAHLRFVARAAVCSLPRR